MVVSERCTGANLLNHIKQKHSDKNIVIDFCYNHEYVSDSTNTEIEIINSHDPKSWICILNIQGTKFVHSGKSRKLALNSILNIADKNLRELLI